MTAMSKNVCFELLDNIVDKYNNTYYNSIEIKPIDIISNSHTECNVDSNAKYAKFKIGSHVRVSEYESIFANGYVPNWSEEVFVISKIKNTVPWTYVFNNVNGEEIVGTFYEKELQKTNLEGFRIEKVIKKKGNKLYVKWKGYDNLLNSWIDKKDII